MTKVDFQEADWQDADSALNSLERGYSIFNQLGNAALNLQQIKSEISKLDSDGAIAFSYTDPTAKITESATKVAILKNFTSQVGKEIHDQIDQPFYEKLDDFVSSMAQLNLTKYHTKNRIGATKTMTYSEYGVNQKHTVQKLEVTMDDLLSGDNFYGNQLTEQYRAWKADHPKETITKDDFRQASIHTRAFDYTSIEDEKKKKEFWTGIVAAVVIIGTSVFCPPAGLALATVYGGLEAGTAIVGKDWLTGRKLDNQERTIRGMFSSLDLIPGLKAFTGGTNLWQASLKGSKMAGMTVKQAGTIARESAASRIRRLGDLAAQTKQAAKNTASQTGNRLQSGLQKIGQTKVPFQPKSSYAAAGGGHIADEGRTVKDALQQFAKDNSKLNFGGKGGIIEGAG